jgi:two-component system sensor histidine kinase RegB
VLPSPAAIHGAWFSRLRAWTVAGVLVVILASQAFLPIDLPLAPLFGVLLVVLASNLALGLRLRRGPVPDAALLGLMLLDVLALTVLLALTGGPANPFSTLYLVYIAWGAVVLRPRATWALVVAGMTGFGILFFVSQPLSGLEAGGHAHAGHHGMGEEHMLHLRGMWIAFGVAAVFIVFFVQRVTSALAQRELELARARDQHAKTQRLAALATLSAGAAHELATPLSTIAVVAKELERSLAADPARSAAAEDARLVREQVQRCRGILDRMAAEAGEAAGERLAAVDAAAVVARLLEGLRPEVRARVEVEGAAARPTLAGQVPLEALARSLRGLVENAVQASPPDAPVRLTVRCDGAMVCFEVRDEGPGMDAELVARVGEPFFTTKAPGMGMGLGVFLARSVAEQLQGRLEYTSAPGAGTTATVRLPRGEVEA